MYCMGTIGKTEKKRKKIIALLSLFRLAKKKVLIMETAIIFFLFLLGEKKGIDFFFLFSEALGESSRDKAGGARTTGRDINQGAHELPLGSDSPPLDIFWRKFERHFEWWRRVGLHT